MTTFLIGLVILAVGGVLYGGVCERVMKPDPDRPTPALAKQDGSDYVPMKAWRNSLIELLNIAGTGPILGPIQGILFGPIAFITIPIGCVIAGAFHDYMCGMISVRRGGDQMPGLVNYYLGKNMYRVYHVVVMVLMLLVGVVFVYTPGDLFVAHILEAKDSSFANPAVIVVYAVIFGYYVLATLLPIDKVIGKVYPLFGAVLLISAVGVFIGIFTHGYDLPELFGDGAASLRSEKLIPAFFVTVTCGMLSGFHSTQATLVSRTMVNERQGRTVFYTMMILEGFIAMTWAGAAIGALRSGVLTPDFAEGVDMLAKSPVTVVGLVAKNMLGSVGGIIAIIGVIILPVTSGDTALRSIRLMLGDALHVDQSKGRNKILLALPIFALVVGVLIWAKSDAAGFQTLWRYFNWANDVLAVMAFAVFVSYMAREGMPYIMALVPGTFYAFVAASYILTAPIGLRLPETLGYILGAVLAALYCGALVRVARFSAPRLKTA